MFEKEAEEYATRPVLYGTHTWKDEEKAFKDGAEFGYNKANEWHKASDKLPEMDVLVYLWNGVDDFPVVACRHIFHGKKEWVWDCKWGSGFTVSQSVGYLWKEIVLP